MPAKIYKYDLYGKRQTKLTFLESHKLSEVNWQELPDNNDVWRLEGEGKGKYMQGFSVAELFIKNGVGIVTARDEFVIDKDKNRLEKRMKDFINLSIEEARYKYNLRKDVQSWTVESAQNTVRQTQADVDNIKKISYRPFDTRNIYYSPKSSGILARPSGEIMQHFLKGENVGLIANRQVKAGDEWQHVFVTSSIVESSLISNKTGEIGSAFPLYLYDDFGGKIPNLKKEIWEELERRVNSPREGWQPEVDGVLLQTTDNQNTSPAIAGTPQRGEWQTTPEDILDYIYGYLHLPSYRSEFAEFLKTDFPRVPYPSTKEEFFRFAQFGKKLRDLHLMISPEVENFITTFPVGGSDEVESIKYIENKVWINSTQYFGNVPEVSWNFYIGGYQPAQKYLKDRKGSVLNNHEIEQYQRIIKVLCETAKIMREMEVKLAIKQN
jgi:predicted helicase